MYAFRHGRLVPRILISDFGHVSDTPHSTSEMITGLGTPYSFLSYGIRQKITPELLQNEEEVADNSMPDFLNFQYGAYCAHCSMCTYFLSPIFF